LYGYDDQLQQTLEVFLLRYVTCANITSLNGHVLPRRCR